MSSTTRPTNGRSSRLTIRQVADLAGVSTATVSRVINGRTEVSERAREAVLRVVREHGYSTNRTARALSGGRTGLVGVTTPVVHHSYFAVILDGAGEALYEQDMRMVLCPTHHEHDREASLLERLMQGTTDGALLILPEESPDELAALHRCIVGADELSVVGFDDTFEASIVTPTLTTVRQPLAEMGRMAVNLLVRQLQNQRIEALHVQLETKLVVRESTAPVAVRTVQ